MIWQGVLAPTRVRTVSISIPQKDAMKTSTILTGREMTTKLQLKKGIVLLGRFIYAVSYMTWYMWLRRQKNLVLLRCRDILDD